VNQDSKEILSILEHHNVFLTGGAGVGKSYTTKEIIQAYEKLNLNVVALASTGIASVHIGGQTVHSFFKLGISKVVEEMIDIKLYPQQRKLLKNIISNLHLLIIDEISMISASVMDMIFFRLKQFGFKGKVMVVGDFLQLPPVQKNDDILKLQEVYNIQDEDIDKYFGYAFMSDSWKKFNFYKYELTTVKRTTNKEFIKYLEDIRYGICKDEIKQFIHSIVTNRLTKQVANSSTLLYATNHKVKTFNHQRLQSNPNPQKNF
jgi:ATP-dependent exoDNAse (exonuclease V) alpha subunit